MYLVTLDGNVLHDTRIKNYQLINPVCALAVNKTNSFTFSILPTHPMYNSIKRMKSIIEVFDDGELIFRGRALNDTSNFNKITRIECEGELGYFNDSVMEPYNHFGNLRELLTLFISNHNSQVDDYKKFTLGVVNFTGDLVRSNVEYSNSWEELSSKTFGSNLGGYLHLRRESEINYIDYLLDSPYISGQSIELSKNMLDYEKTVKANDIATILIPLGARLLDAEGMETNERLTVETVNLGSKFVKNEAGISKYGYVVAYKIWDDIKTPQILKDRATNDLNFLINLGLSIKIRAIDLNLVDKEIPKIRFFQYVRIKSNLHEIDEEMLIKKQTIYLDNPSNNTIEVGVELSTFTDSQLESSNTIKIINANYITNEKLLNVTTPINTQVSEILQKSNLIELSVKDIKKEIEDIELTPGPPGTGIKSTTIAYQKSTSGTTAPTGTWSPNVPTPTAGQYLWTRTITTYTDNTSVTTYSVSYYAKDGSSGNGIKSSKTTYQLHTSGSTAPTGAWLDAIPTIVKDRFLWTRTVLTFDDDTSSTSYSTSYYPLDGQKGDKGLDGSPGKDGTQGLQGPKGDQGIPGRVGADGKTSYTHIAYANSSSGAEMSQEPTGKTYTGMYTDFTSEDSTDPSKYRWNLNKGLDGAQGVPGKVGADGKTPYFHTAWSTSQDGSTGFSTTVSAGKSYIGTYTDHIAADSTDPSKYKWVLILGPKGDKGDTGARGAQGIPGIKGADGIQYYTWLKYADTPLTGISDVPNGKKYMGLSTNRTTAIESEDYEDYTWSLIEGPKGDQGIPGKIGADGKPTYTWVKYADTPTAGMSDSPDGKKYIGLAFNKATATESNAHADYQWSLMPQNITVGGRNLLQLKKGLDAYGSYSTAPVIDGTIFEVTIKKSRYPALKSHSWRLPVGQYTWSGFVLVNGLVPTRFVWGTGAIQTQGNKLVVDEYDETTGKFVITQSIAETTADWFFHKSNMQLKENDIIRFIDMKIETGNVPTDYSIPIEDLQDELDDNKNKIEGVDKTTKENTSQISLNTLGIQQEINDRTKMGERIIQETNLLVDATSKKWGLEFTRLETGASETEASLQELKSYYRYTAEEALIGKSGDPMQFYFSNDEAGFRENGDRLSYWKGKKFYVQDLHVLSSIIIGQHLVESKGDVTIFRSVI